MSNAISDEDIVTISKALADRTRLGMLRTIAKRGCVCCGDVARAFDAGKRDGFAALDVGENARVAESGNFVLVDLSKL